MTENIPENQHITYQLQYRKCGKTSCGTCRKSQGHGPYWYAYWREGSRLRSGYIGKNNPKKPGAVLATSKKRSPKLLTESLAGATATAMVI